MWKETQVKVVQGVNSLKPEWVIGYLLVLTCFVFRWFKLNAAADKHNDNNPQW